MQTGKTGETGHRAEADHTRSIMFDTVEVRYLLVLPLTEEFESLCLFREGMGDRGDEGR